MYLICRNSGSECSAFLQQAEHMSPGISILNTLNSPTPLFSIQGLNMGPQPHAVTKAEIPNIVLYTVGTCVLIIGSVGIIGNLLVLYAFYRYKKSCCG